MTVVLYLLALLCGAALTVQIGANATVRGHLHDNAGAAALASFVVGIVALLSYLLAARLPWPERSAIQSVPAWGWAGGLLGAFYVVAGTVLGPRLGATAFLSLVILGQLLAALAVDHFGVLGFPQHSLSLARVAGAALLLAGALLVTR